MVAIKVPDADHASTSHPKHSRKDSRPKLLEGPVLTHPTKYTYRPDTALEDLFPVSSNQRKIIKTQQPQTQSGLPRRGESLQLKGKASDKLAIHSMPEGHASDLEVTSPVERPKTAPITESSDVSISTPVSASTDRMPNHPSTALTTAAVTPSRPSERGSQHSTTDNDQHHAIVEQADSAAVEWMRRELEKRRQRQDREAQAAQATQNRNVGSRGRSFSNGIREYIRPRTASNSRPTSRGGCQGSESTNVSRASSTSGWRSWGLQRKSSKISINDASTDYSSSQPDLRAGKKDVDLNRPLPALPSLETWKDPASTTNTGTHIANLMRPKSSREKDAPNEAVEARVVNIQKVKVVPQSLPKLKTEPLTVPLAPPKPRSEAAAAAGGDASPSTKSHKFTSHSKSSSQDSCFSPASSGYPSQPSVDIVKAAERARSKSQENLNGRARMDSTTSSSNLPQRARAPSLASAPRKVSFSTANSHLNGTVPLPRSSSSRPATRAGTTTSTAAVVGENTPNFSRKFSSDFQHFNGRYFDPRQANIADITALPPMPPKSKRSLASLRRIVSQFSLGRDGGSATKKKDTTWIDYGEKDGAGVGIRGIMKGGADRVGGRVPVKF